MYIAPRTQYRQPQPRLRPAITINLDFFPGLESVVCSLASRGVARVRSNCAHFSACGATPPLADHPRARRVLTMTYDGSRTSEGSNSTNIVLSFVRVTCYLPVFTHAPPYFDSGIADNGRDV